MRLDRRLLLAAAAMGGSLWPGLAAAAAPRATVQRGPVVPGRAPDEVWEVWPRRPPGWERVAAWAGDVAPLWPPLKGDFKGIAQPVIGVWRPAKANGGSLLVLPGGGYQFVSWDNEGSTVARRLLPTGVTVYVLAYRLPGDRLGWADEPDAPLADAQRAMRLIRADAAKGGRDPDMTGVLGFSAGAHLAGRVLTRFDLKTYEPQDEKDEGSARPAYAGLIYPLISLRPELISPGARKSMGVIDTRIDELSVETQVRPGNAPTFVMQALDDPVVKLQHSLLMLEALQAAKVPAELHLYQEGGHGFGVSLPPDAPAAAWPEAFVAWGRRQGAFGG